MDNIKVNELIEQFGKRFANVARDYTISLAMSSLACEGKLPIKIKEAINSLSSEQLFALRYLLIKNIDTAVHDTLWSIESYSNYKLIITSDEEDVVDIDDERDSLTDAALGFIDEYSKYNSYEDFLETGELEKKIKPNNLSI